MPKEQAYQELQTNGSQHFSGKPQGRKARFFRLTAGRNSMIIEHNHKLWSPVTGNVKLQLEIL